MFTREAQQLNSDIGGLRSFHPRREGKGRAARRWPRSSCCTPTRPQLEGRDRDHQEEVRRVFRHLSASTMRHVAAPAGQAAGCASTCSGRPSSLLVAGAGGARRAAAVLARCTTAWSTRTARSRWRTSPRSSPTPTLRRPFVHGDRDGARRRRALLRHRDAAGLAGRRAPTCRAGGVVRALVTASFVTPPFLGAIAWEILAAPNSGILNVLYR